MKPLLISSGEPAGVGPDLCLALAEYDSPLVILGDQAVLEARAKELGRPICFTPYQSGQVVVPQSGHLSFAYSFCIQRCNHIPETTTPSNTKLGKRAELYIHGSLATSTSLFQNFRWLSAIFISPTF